MLRQAKDLNDYKLGARDGEIGAVKEFYFDDQSWAVRYLVADSGRWLNNRQVLIATSLPIPETGGQAGKSWLQRVGSTESVSTNQKFLSAFLVKGSAWAGGSGGSSHSPPLRSAIASLRRTPGVLAA